jgi:hypothetical protein
MFKIDILTFNKTHINPETKNIHQIKHQKPTATFGQFQNHFILKKKSQTSFWHQITLKIRFEQRKTIFFLH